MARKVFAVMLFDDEHPAELRSCMTAGVRDTVQSRLLIYVPYPVEQSPKLYWIRF